MNIAPPPTPLGLKKQQPGCPFKWTMFLPFTLSFSAAGKKKKTETPLASTRHVKTILMLPISCEQNKYEKKKIMMIMFKHQTHDSKYLIDYY